MMTSVNTARTSPAVRSRTELLDVELKTLYRVSRLLSRSLDLKETLTELLDVLHNEAGMLHGLVTLMDPDSGTLIVNAIHRADGSGQVPTGVRYRRGEGIVGTILQSGQPVVLGRLGAEPRFLDRLSLYDWEAPFIGVPIREADGNTIGVLAVQPDLPPDELLAECTRFIEMVANLIVQTVRLSTRVASEQRDLTDERDELRRTVRGKYGFDNMVVGHTSSMRRVFEQVRRVAKWNTTVLIRGESGTGKELIASAIHYNSPLAHRAFVKLNCAALPENLLESELFGHEKGAFTGAMKQHKGRFEKADGGTLFLDEIGEISPLFQAKLLRVLQEGEFERVGGAETIKVRVRIVAATNRSLESEVERGNFREDLYYRLNVMPIQLPPLRERIADLPDLVQFLLSKLSEQQGRKLEITDNAVRLLMGHSWPGNVRELENCLECAAIMSEEGVIDRDAINLLGSDGEGPSPARLTASDADLEDPDLDERERVIAALEQAGWVQAKAARLLGMTPRQIAYRIQTMNIQVRRL